MSPQQAQSLSRPATAAKLRGRKGDRLEGLQQPSSGHPASLFNGLTHRSSWLDLKRQLLRGREMSAEVVS